MSADLEIVSGDWMPKRLDPGEVRLQQHDLVDTAPELGDPLDLARAGAIEDELMVARDRERSTARTSLRLTRYPALLETASTPLSSATDRWRGPSGGKPKANSRGSLYLPRPMDQRDDTEEPLRLHSACSVGPLYGLACFQPIVICPVHPPPNNGRLG